MAFYITCSIISITKLSKALRRANNIHLAALENSQSADDHGDEGEVEDKQRDNKRKQVNCQVANDEEENEGVDVMGGDDGAQPQDTSPRCPVN